MGVQRTVYDPVAIKFAMQEERVRRRLAVPSTNSAMWERPKRAPNQWTVSNPRPGSRVKPKIKAVLTQDEVREIRAKFEANPTKRGVTAILARHYGVDRRTINDIRRRVTWTYVV